MAASVLLASLQQAMLSERDGVQFYSMAAKQAEDSGAVRLFEQLANEERRHFSVLQKEYQSILDTGAWDPNTVWESPLTPKEPGHIFSADFIRRVKGRHLEMAALSIGILLEKQSFEFYSKQVEMAEDPIVKTFFRELVQWEEGHYKLLLREDDALKEEYWSANRFSPLL
jgi:rubrerythrin